MRYYLNLAILTFFLLLSILGAYMASQVMYSNQIVGGGYLYGEDGSVIGMWDKWERIELPKWLLPIYCIIWVLWSAPLWYQLLYFPTALYVSIVYILPHVLTTKMVKL
jgi:hypothetical protein